MLRVSCTSKRMRWRKRGEGVDDMDCWYNVENYRCPKIGNRPHCKPSFIPARCWPLRVSIFRFTNDAVRPVTLELDGMFLQPNRSFETDKGSVPLCLAPILPRDRYEVEMIFHDSPYQRLDRHGAGYWVSKSLDGPYTFEPFSRYEVDGILRASMRIPIRADWNEDARDYIINDRDHATAAMAATVYGAVRAFGPRW
jgi:hypothetical protein